MRRTPRRAASSCRPAATRPRNRAFPPSESDEAASASSSAAAGITTAQEGATTLAQLEQLRRIAGKGGLNLTHSEARPAFDARYRERQHAVARWLDGFDAAALRAWAAARGVETFVGSSGRVFPVDLKAAPLLRGWVRGLRDAGVRFHVHHRWTGWAPDGHLRFETPAGVVLHAADASVLALGGASWPELGSDGAWVPVLAADGVDVAPLVPANCGFDVAWSAHLRARHAGAPLKPVVLHWHDAHGVAHALQGECVLTATGIEGSAVYAAAADLRDLIARDGVATLTLDLAPGRDLDRLQEALLRPRGRRSIGEHVRRATGLDAVKSALLFEVLPRAAFEDASRLAATIKRLPLRLQAPRPVAEAISSAGGVAFEALDAQLMESPCATHRTAATFGCRANPARQAHRVP